jgi:hypothetical protein
MVDITTIKQAAQIVTDEHGDPVVQLPLSMWEALVDSLESERPQHERIKALLAEWDAQADDMPDGWWDEFDAFLAEHRMRFDDYDTGPGG